MSQHYPALVIQLRRREGSFDLTEHCGNEQNYPSTDHIVQVRYRTYQPKQFLLDQYKDIEYGYCQDYSVWMDYFDRHKTDLSLDHTDSHHRPTFQSKLLPSNRV
jgi:hypothetical protein